jgi:hypothetical protein
VDQRGLDPPRVDLDGLREPANRDKLKCAFADPEQLRPGLTRRHVTELAAEKFASLARDLRAAGHEPHTVAHFVNRLVFCMFAEDIGPLTNAMFTRMLKAAAAAPEQFEILARVLFAAMTGGGMVGFEAVDWFNGGLFDDDTALPLSRYAGGGAHQAPRARESDDLTRSKPPPPPGRPPAAYRLPGGATGRWGPTGPGRLHVPCHRVDERCQDRVAAMPASSGVMLLPRRYPGSRSASGLSHSTHWEDWRAREDSNPQPSDP